MSDSIEMVWETPPKTRRQVSYGKFYTNLTDHPRRWAVYPGTQSAASQWCESHAGYEYKSTMVDGERRVWMRYVGENND